MGIIIAKCVKMSFIEKLVNLFLSRPIKNAVRYSAALSLFYKNAFIYHKSLKIFILFNYKLTYLKEEKFLGTTRVYRCKCLHF